VNQIGLKSLEDIGDERKVAQVGRIKAQVFFQRKGQKAPRQLEGPDVAVFDESLGAVAGTDAEEGKIAPPRKGLKVAAGVGDTVDLVERVGEVGDAGGGPIFSGAGGVGVASLRFAGRVEASEMQVLRLVLALPGVAQDDRTRFGVRGISPGFRAELSLQRATADPSTAFAARCAAKFTQDDISVFHETFRLKAGANRVRMLLLR